VSDIEKWLSEGDLRNDGMAEEVVKIVLLEPSAFDDTPFPQG